LKNQIENRKLNKISKMSEQEFFYNSKLLQKIISTPQEENTNEEVNIN
jgi:hypothetical protein